MFSDEGTLSIYGHVCLDAEMSVEEGDHCTVMQHYDFIFDFTQLGILFSYISLHQVIFYTFTNFNNLLC